MSLSKDRKVVELAVSLGLSEKEPVASIRDFCLESVASILDQSDIFFDMKQIQIAVCAALRVKVHYIYSDQDLENLSDFYVKKGVFLFSALEQLLDGPIYGFLTSLGTPKNAEEEWAAIIDCRGLKYQKKHWTLWHEIVHRLTLPNVAQPQFRKTEEKKKKDPLEVLTDQITRDLAFYGKIFNPILTDELSLNDGLLTFRVAERVRARFHDDASKISTLIACLDRCGSPGAYVEAAMSASKRDPDTKSLRVKKVFCNSEFRSSGFYIPPNYRIPRDSCISRSFYGRLGTSPMETSLIREEELSSWIDSSGRSLPKASIKVEAALSSYESVKALIFLN